MNFGEAIQALKNNKMVRREGWNGKNMHIYLEDMFSFPIKGGVYAGEKRNYEPVVCLYTSRGTHQPGWVCSQADMLAEDWEIVNE